MRLDFRLRGIPECDVNEICLPFNSIIAHSPQETAASRQPPSRLQHRLHHGREPAAAALVGQPEKEQS